MAIHRTPPTCGKCGEPFKAIHKDQSDIPPLAQIIGDTFIGWDYSNHKCKMTNERKRWEAVPVDKELPELNKVVPVFTSYGTTLDCRYNENGWQHFSLDAWRECNIVTHWLRETVDAEGEMIEFAEHWKEFDNATDSLGGYYNANDESIRVKDINEALALYRAQKTETT